MTPRGRTLPLSSPRRAVNDVLHFARRIPTVPVQRVVDVSRLAAARRHLTTPVGWCAILTKAFAQVCTDVPELRRAYLRFPRERLYEHPFSVASIAVERRFGGEPGVFFANVPRPDEMPLPELEAAIRAYKTRPVEEAFRLSLRFFRLPRLVRRGLWWYLLNVRGSRKAEFLGTFGVSAYSALGAESLHPLSPLTCLLTYGVIAADGRVPIRVVYDHRVFDGVAVARALARLDEVLGTAVLGELTRLATPAAGAA
ncbi:MAG: hypothetical protein ABGY75_21540 [Gemmataceae bacterium]